MDWKSLVETTLSSAASQAGSEAMSRGIGLLLDDSPDSSQEAQPGGELTGGDHSQELRDAAMLDIAVAVLSLHTSRLKFSWDKDEYYEGEMRNGEPHGRGTYDYSGGDDVEMHFTYVGDWQKGVPHGRGVLKAAECRYAGEWREGDPHGRGVFISIYGRYEGDWIEGKPYT